MKTITAPVAWHSSVSVLPARRCRDSGTENLPENLQCVSLPTSEHPLPSRPCPLSSLPVRPVPSCRVPPPPRHGSHSRALTLDDTAIQQCNNERRRRPPSRPSIQGRVSPDFGRTRARRSVSPDFRRTGARQSVSPDFRRTGARRSVSPDFRRTGARRSVSPDFRRTRARRPALAITDHTGATSVRYTPLPRSQKSTHKLI